MRYIRGVFAVAPVGMCLEKKTFTKIIVKLTMEKISEGKSSHEVLFFGY